MPENDLILNDVRVLDLSAEVAGPFCTKLLAGLGAEVIKVESPGCGDVARRTGPFPGAEPHPEQSALFLYLNTGKKSVTLDIASQTGAAMLRRLAQKCDILVESFRPGYLNSWGLSYDALEGLNPGLIYTSVTPFGQSGPYRDYRGSELIAQATGGLMQTIGLPDREPLKIGGHAALYTTGISAFSATMIALYARDVLGHGHKLAVLIGDLDRGLRTPLGGIDAGDLVGDGDGVADEHRLQEAHAVVAERHRRLVGALYALQGIGQLYRVFDRAEGAIVPFRIAADIGNARELADAIGQRLGGLLFRKVLLVIEEFGLGGPHAAKLRGLLLQRHLGDKVAGAFRRRQGGIEIGAASLRERR